MTEDEVIKELEAQGWVVEDGMIGFTDHNGCKVRMTIEQLMALESEGELVSAEDDGSEPYPYFKFVKIEPCTFMMGSPETEKGRSASETPHEVTISKPFFIMTTPFTQAMWDAVLGEGYNPSESIHPDKPVTNVSWYDVQEFLKIINQAFAPFVFRLPTEAEWECACRAGSAESIWGKLEDIAWVWGTTSSRTEIVGQKVPNAAGLYDMLGNVAEWCDDFYGDYSVGPVTDPTGVTLEEAAKSFLGSTDSDGNPIPVSTYLRVIRGGSTGDTYKKCRAAARGCCFSDFRNSGTLGFRLVSDDLRIVDGAFKIK